MRAGDSQRRGTIRLLLSSIHNAEIAARKPLDAVDLLSVLTREAKQRRESIEEFRKANRPDLAEKEGDELAIIMAYLPAQMSRQEIVEFASQIILRLGAAGLADKGRVMPVIMAELRGRADGSEINSVVSELLST